mmetsp:Transcript_35068/g.53813  ORF Transcript_35068/g.53813 Transcript_35068/m.53813 type:complete len:93 (+) Transcript_35068:43-321(+)
MKTPALLAVLLFVGMNSETVNSKAINHKNCIECLYMNRAKDAQTQMVNPTKYFCDSGAEGGCLVLEDTSCDPINMIKKPESCVDLSTEPCEN